jgi:hypothetical protein
MSGIISVGGMTHPHGSKLASMLEYERPKHKAQNPKKNSHEISGLRRRGGVKAANATQVN